MRPIQHCHYCGRDFVPDRRGRTPKACSRKRCRKARHDQAHRRYVQANPNVYQGFYPKTRQWLQDHYVSPSEGGWLEAFAKLDATLAA